MSFGMKGAHERRMREEAPAATAKPKPPVQSHGGEAPDIHIKSHSAGHTVHVMHKDGGSDKSEHQPGDTEGIKAKIDEHLGGGLPEMGGEEKVTASHDEEDYGLGR